MKIEIGNTYKFLMRDVRNSSVGDLNDNRMIRFLIEHHNFCRTNLAQYYNIDSNNYAIFEAKVDKIEHESYSINILSRPENIKLIDTDKRERKLKATYSFEMHEDLMKKFGIS